MSLSDKRRRSRSNIRPGPVTGVQGMTLSKAKHFVFVRPTFETSGRYLNAKGFSPGSQGNPGAAPIGAFQN
ncbi:hypothetical protein G3N57_26220 [Paraburkholderia sp. Se-20369]|nr:hypothetical protein [Paraburkholderia sp. Se-20369]